MDLYAENILDHFRNPRCHGALEDATVKFRVTNPACGDDLTLTLKIENDAIEAVGWSGQGCVPIGPRRTKCALLCLHALKNALHALNNEPAQSWTETIGE